MRHRSSRALLPFVLPLLLTACCGAAELEAEVVRLNGELDQLKMESLADEMMLEKCESENEELLGEVGALERAAAPPSWGGGRVGQPGPESALRCLEGEDHYAIPPEALDDLNQLSMSLRVVPHYRDGRPYGLKLFGIPGDSLPASCGFGNGDVVTALNDLPLTNPTEALDAYATVVERGVARFTVDRRGEVRQVRIRVGEEETAAP